MGSPVVAASPRKSPSTGRRTNKPLVEKKRRARINGCLGQLKSLILSAMQTEGAQVSRLEKADILEMTVKYLRHVQLQQTAPEPEVTAKFSAGYTECASEVIRYIDTVKCITPDVRSRLENHLVERLRGSATLTPAVQAPQVHHQPKTGVSPPMAISNSDTDQTMSRHYQTAVELANMAASVALQSTGRSSLTTIRQSSQASASLPETTTSTTTSQHLNNLTSGHFAQQSAHMESARHLNVHIPPEASRCFNRSQSMSPSALRMEDQDLRTSAGQFYHSVDERLRHNGSEPAMHVTSSSTPLLAAPKQEIFYAGNDANNNINQPMQLDYRHVIKSESDYLSTFQRPLHIHIPDSPHPLPSTPPPSLHLHQTGFQAQPSQRSVGAPSPSATSMDDGPPTILYGYNGPQMASPYHKIETLSPCSPKTSGNEVRAGGNIECTETFDHAEQRASSTFSHDTSRASGSRGGHHMPHVQHPRYPTLSPPTLTREEPYPCQAGNPDDADEVHYNAADLRQPSVVNAMPHCYMPELGPYNAISAPRVPCPAGECSNYSDQHTGQLNISGQYRKQKERDTYYPPGPAQQYNPGHQSFVSQDPSGRTAQATTAKSSDNGQHALNGPAPRHHPSVHSRQKDTSLSPPTLKRRILCALGPGGEWTAPPKSEERSDPLGVRERLQCVSDNGQNKPRRRETRTSLCRDGGGFLVPAAAGGYAPCRAAVSSHSGADENLWRPW